MEKIIVYGRDNCNYCAKAKEFLTKRGTPYTYVDIEVPGFDLDQLKRTFAPFATTIPIVLIDNKYVGGYVELKRYMDNWVDDIAKLRNCLNSGQTMTVVFTKQDGSERVMHCTINPYFIPENKRPTGMSTVKDPYLFTVFDLVEKDWRSFKAQSVKRIV